MEFIRNYDSPGRPTENYRLPVLEAILRDKNAGNTYEQLAVKYGVGKTTACRMVRRARDCKEMGMLRGDKL